MGRGYTWIQKASFVFVLIAVLVWLLFRESSTQSPRVDFSLSESRAESQAEAEPLTSNSEAIADESLVSSANELVEKSDDVVSQRDSIAIKLSGEVLGQQNDPVVGAMVSWTPYSLFQSGLLASSLTYKEWSSRSVLTTTDAEGRFAFDADQIDEPGVVWVTAVGKVAAFQDADQNSTTLHFELEEETEWTVKVEDADPDDEVWVYLKGLGKYALNAGGSDRPFADQLLMRRFRAAASGETAFAGAKRFLLHAEVEGRAGPTSGPFDEHSAILSLDPGVIFQGRVQGVEGNLPARVYVSFETKIGLNERLGEMGVLADGSLTSLRVPTREWGSYRVQLEGPMLAAQVLKFPSDEVNGAVILDFVLEPTTELRFRTIDAASQPIEGAVVWLVWPSVKGSGYETMESSFETNSEGFVQFSVPLSGEVYVDSSAEGFMDQEWGPLDIPTYAPFVNDLMMSPSGRIEGRVLFDGKPVRDFSIAHFQGSGFRQYSPVSFEDREEGTFTFKDVATGETEIFATAHGYAQSTPQLIEIVPGEVTHVELELGVGGAGVGQVLDSETRLPIPGLQVHRCVFARSGAIGAEWDAFVEPRSDGEFEVSGMVGEQGRVAFRAEGYSDGDAYASRKPDGTYDFGLTLLTRAMDYSGMVKLPVGVDPTSVSFETTGATYFGPAKLDAGGRFSAPGATAGFVLVDFVMPGYATISTTQLLTGSGPWEHEYDLSGSSSLRVFVDGQSDWPDGIDVDDCEISLEMASANYLIDNESRSFGLPDNPEEGVLCTGLLPGYYSVALYASPRVLLAMGSVDVLSDAENEVHLSIQGEQRAIRVVNQQREPVDSAYVTIAGTTPNGVKSKGYTNEEGVVLLGFLSDGPKAIHIGDYSEAQLDVVLDEIGTTENPTEIVYAPSTSVILRVNDRGTPLEGATIMVESTLTSRVISWTTVAKGGSINMNSVSPGPVRIFTLSPGLWQEYRSAVISDDQAVIDVQFRRLGAFEIKVTDTFGKPIANAPVALTSDEYGVDVATWLAEGKVQSSSGIATDANGTVRIDGLPNGLFTWQAAGQSGTTTVPPNGVGSAKAKIVE